MLFIFYVYLLYAHLGQLPIRGSGIFVYLSRNERQKKVAPIIKVCEEAKRRQETRDASKVYRISPLDAGQNEQQAQPQLQLYIYHIYIVYVETYLCI